MVSTSGRLSGHKQIQNVVISMTGNQPTPRPRGTQALRRVTRAFKRINDEQVLMWEAFWRSSRFPTD
jgi:hypothetical protein